MVARIPPQGPEVAALGLGAPPAVAAAPTACSPPGAGPRKLRAQPGSAARRHEREVLLGERRAKTRCATSRGPSQGRGVRVEDMVGCGVTFPSGKCSALGIAGKLSVGRCGLEGAAWERPLGLCVASGDPGEGLSVSRLDTVGPSRDARTPFAVKAWPCPTCLFLL